MSVQSVEQCCPLRLFVTGFRFERVSRLPGNNLFNIPRLSLLQQISLGTFLRFGFGRYGSGERRGLLVAWFRRGVSGQS
jgi:hypothetical protein